MINNRPIGIFDSGVGGLTVLQALQRRLPRESTIYLGDLARCPYGTRDQDEVRAFATEIGDALIDEGIKLLVVACNTATAAAFDHLRDRYDIPVVGVIEPAVQAALAVAPNRRIGVVATDGTVGSRAYSRAIHAHAPEALVEERSASWLVPIIEQGPVARAHISSELVPLLAGLDACGVEALILGCTHFPLVRDVFEAEVGDGVAVLDSAETTARQVADLLRALNLESDGPAQHRLLVTGPATAFAERARTMFQASPVIETLTLAASGRAGLRAS